MNTKRNVAFVQFVPSIFHASILLLFLLLQEIYKDRKKFSRQVFEVASSDLVNMGITVVSYTLKDVRDDMVSVFVFCLFFSFIHALLQNPIPFLGYASHKILFLICAPYKA